MKLTQDELLRLFCFSVENAHHMFVAAQEIKLHPRLGLAELALEELGKSYSCLAYYSVAQEMDDWKHFWKEWTSHKIKAYRAFRYEMFCTLRIEVVDGNAEKHFPSLRDTIPFEKELAFYVDIDRTTRKIHVPQHEISEYEALSRLTSFAGLFNAALFVKDWMLTGKSKRFKEAIADYAYRTIAVPFYQQEVQATLERMKTGEPDYDDALGSIWELFQPKSSA